MYETLATIRNEQGIHCRPSAVIIKALQGYAGDITIRSESYQCNTFTMVGIMSLGLEVGTTIAIQVEGADEESVGLQLVELFERVFDFPPQ
ncbi:MAG: phosphotransferase system HPr (HPr) family protein [Candidatus Omnitrophota bacterium]|jgi:phosphocarrier protein HPr